MTRAVTEMPDSRRHTNEGLDLQGELPIGANAQARRFVGRMRIGIDRRVTIEWPRR
jgi:hypothetical protein